ncbi:winged helix-turn-helix transcriptional regulator [Amycolatopsis sp. NPDC057786]|uniref:winged helix-turn-helix transcriptional regulator n=1 Tax=Amycolatopsis sp. NPDC057786 TaxID=3346250 RepID=UPI00366B1317
MPDHPTAELAWLVSQPCAVEILDVLAETPRPLTDLHRQLKATRRTISSALRVLAAAGVVRRRGHCGSWDILPPPSTRYELTATGREFTRQLNRVEVWTTLYEHYLGAPTTKKRTKAMWAPISILLLLACLGNMMLGHSGHAILFGIAWLGLVAAVTYRARHRTT